jgi:hypothetical protein
MAEAERAAAQGHAKQARALYHRAAEEEVRALTHIPASRSRTRGIIAVSAVALFRKSGAFDDAVRHASCYLGQDHLPDFAREQLQDLLVESQRDREGVTLGRTQAE